MRTRGPVALILVAALVLSAASARAATPVVEATLDNGLRVLVLEDRRSPIVSVQVWYRVGSRNERPGATGLAHFLEHMMFKGTPAQPKGTFRASSRATAATTTPSPPRTPRRTSSTSPPTSWTTCSGSRPTACATCSSIPRRSTPSARW